MSTPTAPTSFLPYHESGIVTILTQASLLLVLNIVNTVLDQLIFCGLLGQVFVGVAWGTPGAKWLSSETEHTIVQLGYLGLILLVYEGGLSTDFRSLKANLVLSIAVAITGICFPIGLSFVLLSLSNATPLQAFAAGAALCSTSLGTTFTILSTSGLSSTRLGTVLSSAAMMDDVVGLIMVQVISNLGQSSDTFSAVTVARPLAVSIGLAIAVPLLCRFIALPLTKFLNKIRKSSQNGIVEKICTGKHTAFIVHTLILLGLVTGATYAGTSNLFAAYLAGASVSWWDSEVPHVEVGAGSPSTAISAQDNAVTTNSAPSTESPERSQAIASSEDIEETASPYLNTQCSTATTGTEVFHAYFATALQRILKPFFFASIGFAIPIKDMFKGQAIWRGLVYTILMLFAKLITGIWLIRLNVSSPKIYVPRMLRVIVRSSASCVGLKISSKEKGKSRSEPIAAQEGHNSSQGHTGKNENDIPLQPTPTTANTDPSPPPASSSPIPSQHPKINKPLSLYPAAMLGTAMTARGEIGFLIASLAETTGLFSSTGKPSSESSEIYLVVTWAIVLCTVIGPLGIGTLVKRVRRLQRERREGKGKSERGDPLGIWGVS